MKIDIERNVVEFAPETPDEKAKLETLWRILIDCAGMTGKLAPIGEYVPAKGQRAAAFHIEGAEGGEQADTVTRVDSDCVCYCPVCNKQVTLKAGDPIPLCCGRIMEIVD